MNKKNIINWIKRVYKNHFVQIAQNFVQNGFFEVLDVDNIYLQNMVIHNGNSKKMGEIGVINKVIHFIHSNCGKKWVLIVWKESCQQKTHVLCKIPKMLVY